MHFHLVCFVAISGGDAHVGVVQDIDDLLALEALNWTVGDVLRDFPEGGLERVVVLQSDQHQAQFLTIEYGSGHQWSSQSSAPPSQWSTRVGGLLDLLAMLRHFL